MLESGSVLMDYQREMKTNNHTEKGTAGYLLLWLLGNSGSCFAPDFSVTRLHLALASWPRTPNELVNIRAPGGRD
jgi:hypothetical protein